MLEHYRQNGELAVPLWKSVLFADGVRDSVLSDSDSTDIDLDDSDTDGMLDGRPTKPIVVGRDRAYIHTAAWGSICVA